MSQTPSIGRIVHYHSYGTPGGEFSSHGPLSLPASTGRKSSGCTLRS